MTFTSQGGSDGTVMAANDMLLAKFSFNAAGNFLTPFIIVTERNHCTISTNSRVSAMAVLTAVFDVHRLDKRPVLQAQFCFKKRPEPTILGIRPRRPRISMDMINRLRGPGMRDNLGQLHDRLFHVFGDDAPHSP